MTFIELAPYIAIGAAVAGFAIGWFWRSRLALSSRIENRREIDQLRFQVEAAGSEKHRLTTELAAAREALDRERSARIEAEVKQGDLDQMRAFLEEARQRLEASYAQLSSKALDGAVENLRRLVTPVLEKNQGEISAGLERKRLEIENLLQPVTAMLESYRTEIREVERKRDHAFGSIGQSIETLRSETSRLASALRAPSAAGNWGENTLRRCVELAGMNEYCDFDTQMTFDLGDGRSIRPDLIVTLPDERVIAIDAKVPVKAFLDAAGETDEKLRAEALAIHATNVKRHIDILSRKDYQEHIQRGTKRSLDFTVLFMGGEQYLSSALMTDQGIWEYAATRKVVLASPMILVPLLQALATGWRAEKLEESAQKALETAEQLYDRFCIFASHFQALGRNLDQATGKFNEALRSFETRLEPKAREVRDLTRSRRELERVDAIDSIAATSVKLEELTSGDGDAESTEN
ncbi:MAG: DNA recombination protein RmuC [Acidobacteria bacterium]|nr:DNA recombination protein RmuC [Acidobacteriota bacterium]